jgi:hypothetical protein
MIFVSFHLPSSNLFRVVYAALSHHGEACQVVLLGKIVQRNDLPARTLHFDPVGSYSMTSSLCRPSTATDLPAINALSRPLAHVIPFKGELLSTPQLALVSRWV